MLHAIKNFTLDTLFPITCLSCSADGVWLCQGCFKKIDTLSSQVCPYCEKVESLAGTICPGCKTTALEKDTSLFLDGLIVAAKYDQNDLARLVHTFKYNFVQNLSFPLAALMQKALLDNHLPLPDFIIPVPLHPRRLRWRGFNQAHLLAEKLAENLSPGLPIPVLPDLLTRQKFTRAQMKIKNYQERQANMQNSFGLAKKSIPGKEIIKNKKILLVDDIATTGSTLLECAKVLKMAGAKKVFGIVIARQEFT